MQYFIMFFAYWIVAPIIFIGLIVLSRSLTRRIESPENRLSAKAGFWAGLVLFLVYLISQISSLQTPKFSQLLTLEIQYGGAAAGLIAGFVLLLAIKYLAPTRMIGFLVMLLIFSGLSSLYSFIFIQSFNLLLVSSALGITFGSLLYIMIWPKSIQKLFLSAGFKSSPSSERDEGSRFFAKSLKKE